MSCLSTDPRLPNKYNRTLQNVNHPDVTADVTLSPFMSFYLFLVYISSLFCLSIHLLTIPLQLSLYSANSWGIIVQSKSVVCNSPALYLLTMI